MFELIIILFYLLVIYIVAFTIRENFTNKYTKKLFIPALSAKLFGSTAFIIIYKYYYGYGDTFMYHEATLILHETFLNDFNTGVNLFFSEPDVVNSYFNSTHLVQRIFYLGDAEYWVVKLSLIPSILTYNSYAAMTFLISFISFLGIWKLYSTIVRYFPMLYLELSIAILFVPSTLFWSSGLLKDTYSLAALGFIVANIEVLIIRQKFRLIPLFSLIFFSFILISVKPYIFIMALPTLVLWKFLLIRKYLPSLVRVLSLPLIIIFGSIVSYFILKNLISEEDRFSVDNMTKTAQYQAYHLSLESKDEAKYYVGNFDGSLPSMIEAVPLAILASLYRPAIFESYNAVMLLSGVENSIFSILTLIILWEYGFGFVKILMKSPMMFSFFLYTLAIAVAVGITSGNFGTLVRYRVPLIPFYVSILVVLYFYKSKIKNFVVQKR